ncbi:unnamed protein product [Adineta steineri]|uniref:Uncharacterized protein n=1 Tax=Adineta steineri TaxID=433720 RepID=A0A819CL48_9BILA|nr:unnamed protein product [Adineta steineri]CAF3819761.1 unnamed protein product [Adineta steineri]
MGIGGSIINKRTNELWSFINTDALIPTARARVQQLIGDGADIKQPNKNGQYMIQVLIEQEKRSRLAKMTADADIYQQLVDILKMHASKLLVTALDTGDTGEMKFLVRHLGADCHQGDQLFGQLGLIGHVVQKADLKMEIIQFLIETDSRNKSAITKRDVQRRTVFDLAICQKAIVDYLKEVFNSELNRLPFHSNVDPQLAIQWIKQGANPEWTNDKENTVLCNAILADHFELVKHLVAAQCNTQHENFLKEKPLNIAKNAEKRNLQMIAFLENEGINRQLQTLIQERKANLTLIEVQDLLKQGADIKALGQNHNSLLHLLVVNNGTPEMIHTFVNMFNADIEILNWDGYRPIEISIIQDNLEQLQAFFKLTKFTTEHFFSEKLNKSLLKFAKEKNQPSELIVKAIENELNLRLWKCVSMANEDEKKNSLIVADAKRLCELGAQINHLHLEADGEYREWSVLHLACKVSNLQLIRFLIETLKANRDGGKPMSIAAEYGQLKIVQYLRLLGSKVNVISNNDTQDTPLHLAAKNNHQLVVRYLVLWGADHEAKNTANQTPLDLARMKKTKMTKTDETENKQLIKFLELLDCPDVVNEEQRRPMSPKIINPEIDVCTIPLPILVDQIKPHDINDEDPKGHISLGILAGTPNENLRKAAKTGNIELARDSIAKGADIRHREGKSQQSCYDVATLSIQEHLKKSNVGTLAERSQHRNLAESYQNIAQFLQSIAQTKLIEAIKHGRSDRVLSYHLVGAHLTADLLPLTCRLTDNIEIVECIINKSQENFNAMFSYAENQESPFIIALKSNHKKLADYLNWRLSDELTKAVNNNDLLRVRRLSNAGATVDSRDKFNLLTAVKHNNFDMVVFLYKMGARIPDECLKQTGTKPEIENFLKQRQLDRKLRLAAAHGNFNAVVECQRQGASINAKNCHGSTAVLMAIQHGNYFRIVHTLVSHGASILHSNPKLVTLLQLSKSQNYKQISEYLLNQLNVQFLSAIIDNDLESARKLSVMGVEFDHRDEQKRTPLHYAVQYHGVDIVQWLCESGADWKVADIHGQYPITEAVEKGAFPVVKYFVENWPASKDLKNKAGQNALAIAKACRYNRIVRLLDPDSKVFLPEDGEDEDSTITSPKYTLEQLLSAAAKGQDSIIKEFVEQRYRSLATKLDQCKQMIEIAERHDQQEVLARLRRYYASSKVDFDPSNYLSVTEQQKIILGGFLSYLSGLIAGSDVKLDPSDPKTYHQLYKNLHSTATERVEQLNSVQNEGDIVQIYEQDLIEVQSKLKKLQEELGQMEQNRIKMLKGIETAEEKMSQVKTAIERRDRSKEIQEMKEQMTVLDSEVRLFKEVRLAAEKKKDILSIIQNDTNLVHFFNTVEHRLQSLFAGVYAAQAGMLKSELGSTTGMIQTAIDWIPDSIIPIPEPITFLLKQATTNIVSIIDKTKQNKEYRNISTLGNLQQLQNAATNAAGLLTLYYKEQVELIDIKKKVEGSNKLATFFSWSNKILDGKPDENAIVLVAEYAVAWIIDALKEGERKDKDKQKIKNFVRNQPLADQLWLCVARQNLTNDKIKEKLGFEMGKHKIPLKNGKSIALKFLFGYPTVIIGGLNYQHSSLANESIEDDSIQYTYLYLDPFTDKDISLSIVKQRELIQLVDQSVKSRPDILDNVALFREGGETIPTSANYEGVNLKETAISLASSMIEQKLVVDPDQLKHTVQKVRSDIVHEITLEMNVLREDFNSKANIFQTSIDAAYENITKNFDKCQEDLREAQRVEYQTATRKLVDQMKQSQQHMESLITERTKEMERFLNEKCEQQNVIVHKAEQQSVVAVDSSTKAKESSLISEQAAKQSSAHAQKLVESTEQRKQEMQRAIDDNSKRLEKTIAEQKETYERSFNELKNSARLEMERMREEIERLTKKASESAKASDKSASDARTTQQNANEQIKRIKDENKTLLKEIKEARGATEKAAADAREAEKHARNCDERLKKSEEKIHQMAKKMKLETTD